MKVKVFQTNNQGKVEFTREELEKLLNEMYSEGHKDGEKKSYYSQKPIRNVRDIDTTPYCEDVNTTSIIADNSNGSGNGDNKEKNTAMSYSINWDDNDVYSLSKAVNEIITNASRGARPSTGVINAFDALAKELNF